MLSAGALCGAFSVGEAATPQAATAPHVSTSDEAVSRYGRLEIRGNSDQEAKLYYNNRLVVTAARLEGDNMSFEGAQSLGASDVFVVSVTAGTSCPGMSSVVEVSANRVAKFTKPFGTCSDINKVTRQGDDAIVIRMPTYLNPEHFSEKEINAHLRMKEYVYSHGKIGPEIDRGKPTKADLAFMAAAE